MKVIKYTAKLSGPRSTEYHLECIQSNQLVIVSVRQSNKKIYANIEGTKQESTRDKISQIKEKISKRAQDLNVGDSSLINNTVKDISDAQIAEGIVLLGEMKIEMFKRSTNSEARITLKISFDENLSQSIQVCLEFYASQRILNVAQAMHMNIKSS